jgi:hypothetical protein
MVRWPGASRPPQVTKRKQLDGRMAEWDKVRRHMQLHAEHMHTTQGMYRPV